MGPDGWAAVRKAGRARIRAGWGEMDREKEEKEKEENE